MYNLWQAFVVEWQIWHACHLFETHLMNFLQILQMATVLYLGSVSAYKGLLELSAIKALAQILVRALKYACKFVYSTALDRIMCIDSYMTLCKW